MSQLMKNKSMKSNIPIVPSNQVFEPSSVPQIDELVKELRKKFLECYQNNPQDYDPIDIENIRNNDFPVKRFITYNDLDLKAAFDQLDDAMKWRKSYGVNKLDFSHCGIELFKCGALFTYNEDIEGRTVLYARVKTHIKIPEMEKLMQDIIVIMLNQIDQTSGERGYVVVMDVSGAGLKNVDFGMARFLIKTMRKYFPESLKRVIVYNLPFILRGVMPIVKFILGEKYSTTLISAHGEEIFDYIERKNVPKYLGGDCDKDFTQPPKECKLKAEELAHMYGMPSEAVRKLVEQFHIHMDEAKLLVNIEK